MTGAAGPVRLRLADERAVLLIVLFVRMTWFDLIIVFYLNSVLD
jgi:hypothetical protein